MHEKEVHYLFIAVVLTLFISFLRLLNASNNIAVTHDNSKGEVGNCQLHLDLLQNLCQTKASKRINKAGIGLRDHTALAC